MSNIQKRCDILNQEIEEMKAEILGEFVCNDEEDKIDQLIDLAMMLGEAYVYRDNVVSKINQPEKVEELFNFIKHGGEDHQEWLKEALYCFFSGKEKPEYKA